MIPKEELEDDRAIFRRILSEAEKRIGLGPADEDPEQGTIFFDRIKGREMYAQDAPVKSQTVQTERSSPRRSTTK